MVHLHRHSEYSLLDGLGTAEQYAKRAAELGQFALALTDHGTLSGVLHHMEACQEHGVLPILGVEAYYRDDRTIHAKENEASYHMTLLAKSQKGWRSLMRLISESHASGFYYRPCLDRELLEKDAEDLVCLSSCLSGYVPQALMASDEARVKEYMKWMRGIFGDDYYVELMPHDIKELRTLNPMLVNWANEISAPYVATVDTHYPYKEWSETQDVAILIGRASCFADREKARADGKTVHDLIPTLWLMDDTEVKETFATYQPDLPPDVVATAIKNTDEIALSIIESPVTLSKQDKIPKISETPDAAFEKLDAWCQEGLMRIGKTKDPVYRERLDYELGVIQKFDIVDYFLLVGDIVRWSVEQGIFVEARGSVAGSLVAYLLQISGLDPIAYGLLFERFINPDRKGLPDIDLDFEHTRREEVKAYVGEKYGTDHVADIISYQTFLAKSALGSVARVYSIDFKKMAAISKTIDDGYDGTLEELARINADVDKFSKDFPEAWQHACRLQGQIKARSKHAAGLIITDQPVDTYVPTERAKNGSKVTGWDDKAEQISKYGILKVDMLGVKGLTKWHEALDMIEERTGERPDLNALPVAADPYAVEPEVMKMLGEGQTLGVWQMESRGFTEATRKAQPDDVLDMTALNALYRPGPIDNLGSFTNRKIGKEPIKHFHAATEPFMAETYGILVYQEQIMKIVQALGKVSGGVADDMRKAMGKLYRLPGDEAQRFMQQYYDAWTEGCASQGLSQEESDSIWEQILPFGNYAFNKSHAASYSRRSYIDAWLKYHYPVEFYATLLSYPPSDAAKKKHQQKLIIRESTLRDVKILPPDINDSKLGFSVTDDGIRFGLLGIKQVGDVAVREIIEKQPFSSYEDFEERIVKKKCNASVKKALKMAGAFDRWDMRDDVDDKVKAAWEGDLLGIALTGSASSPQLVNFILRNVHKEHEIAEMDPGAGVILGGDVDNVKKLNTKRGEMAFVDLAVGTHRWSCTVFNDLLVPALPMLNSGQPLMVRGRKDDKGRIIADAIEYAAVVAEESKESDETR